MAVEDNRMSPYDISEDDVDIESKSWDDDDVRLLWTRHMLIKDKMCDYWQPYFDRGKESFDYERGKIFTEKQLKFMQDKEDKYPVQPRIIEARIYSLIGEIIKGRRSGSVTTEGGDLEEPAEDAVKVSIANTLLKDMEKKWRERRLTKDLLHDGLVSCMPVWAWIDKGAPSQGEGVLEARLLPWDSVAVAPFHFRYPEEITAVAFKTFMKEAELIDHYPDMQEQIVDHRNMLKDDDKGLLTSISEWDISISAADRTRIASIASDGATALTMPDGYYEVITRVFQILRKEKVAINLENPKDFYIKPPEWEEERWQAFIEERAKKGVEYSQEQRKVRVLWQTVGTTSGLMLCNKKHWFQRNGRLPGVPFWPTMIDGEITGPGDKWRNKIMMVACAETEFLDEVRKGSGSIWVMRSGYISNVSNFQEEVTKNNGVLTVRSDFPGGLDQVVQNIQRRPNPSTLEYAQKVRSDIEEEDRINNALQGKSEPNQAAIAKSMEIAQGLIAQSEYVENFNAWWENWQDLKCKMIPFAYNTYDIVKVTDEESGQQVAVEVNAPQVGITGDVEAVVNDLSLCDFTFKIMPVDDSPTAKEVERQQALIFLNSVPGPMAQIDPSGELLAQFMLAMPNRILSQVGKKLLASAQQRAQSQQQSAQTQQMLEANERLMKLKNEAEKIKASKVSLSFTGEQMAMYPELTSLLQYIGYFEPAQAQLPPDAVAQQGMGAGMQAPTPGVEAEMVAAM